jgi:hypothetical protein
MNTVYALPQDGVEVIISYLECRDTLSFAFTATYYYATVTQIMSELVPKLLFETWTLYNALQSYHDFNISYKQLKLYIKYFNGGGFISDFTNSVKIDYNIGFALGDDMLLKMSRLYSITFTDKVHTTEQNVPFPTYNELQCLTVLYPIVDIVKLVQKAPNLVRVSFSVKSVGVVEAIGRYCTKVKYLTIIGIGTDFASAISRVLRNKLLYLDIDCTRVSGQFLHTIGDCATSLRELRLREVHFSLEFGGDIMHNLTALHVTGNPKMTPQAAIRLAKIVPNIQVLHGMDTTPFMMYCHETAIIDLKLHTAKHMWPNGTPVSNEKPYFEYFAKWSNLKRLDMHYHLFTLKELQSMHMPSVVAYSGDLIYESEWLSAFNNAFPNIEVISLTNVVKQKRTSIFNDPLFLPRLVLSNRPNIDVTFGFGFYGV